MFELNKKMFELNKKILKYLHCNPRHSWEEKEEQREKRKKLVFILRRSLISDEEIINNERWFQAFTKNHKKKVLEESLAHAAPLTSQ